MDKSTVLLFFGYISFLNQCHLLATEPDGPFLETRHSTYLLRFWTEDNDMSISSAGHDVASENENGVLPPYPCTFAMPAWIRHDVRKIDARFDLHHWQNYLQYIGPASFQLYPLGGVMTDSDVISHLCLQNYVVSCRAFCKKLVCCVIFVMRCAGLLVMQKCRKRPLS